MKKVLITLSAIIFSLGVFAQSYFDRAEKFSVSVLGAGVNLFDTDCPVFGAVGASASVYGAYFDFSLSPKQQPLKDLRTFTWHAGYRVDVKGLGLTPVFGSSVYRSCASYSYYPQHAENVCRRNGKRRFDYGLVIDHPINIGPDFKLKGSIGITRYSMYAGIGVRF